MAEPGRIWRLCVANGVPRRSFWVAAVVGSILNLINQYDALFGPLAVNWYKIALTYCVPYLVATFGAVTARLAAGETAPDNEAGDISR